MKRGPHDRLTAAALLLVAGGLWLTFGAGTSGGSDSTTSTTVTRGEGGRDGAGVRHESGAVRVKA